MPFTWSSGTGGSGWQQWCPCRTSPEDTWHSSWWLTASLLIIQIKGEQWTKDLSHVLEILFSRERTMRLAALSLCWAISKPISYPLGAFLFDSGGYICVFGTSLLLFLLASCFGLYKLWGFEEKIKKQTSTFKGPQPWKCPIISSAIFNSRVDFTKTCDEFSENDIQEARWPQEVLPARHAVHDVVSRHGWRGGVPVPVHVHQEDVGLGGGDLL